MLSRWWKKQSYICQKFNLVEFFPSWNKTDSIFFIYIKEKEIWHTIDTQNTSCKEFHGIFLLIFDTLKALRINLIMSEEG